MELPADKLSAHASKATIFVLIASFRDPECCKTVRDCFAQAKHPGRISMGICWQYNEADPFDCIFEDEPYRDHIRIDRVLYTETGGVCWARRRAQLLLRDEDYVLFVDSHMLFEKNWDESLIQELSLCPEPKSILSAYPASYTLPNHKSYSGPRIGRFAWRATVQPTPQHPATRPIGRAKALPLGCSPIPVRGVTFAAGFAFMPSQTLKEVPYDPYSDWDEEEVCYGLRLWTHGWSIYAPRADYIHHLAASKHMAHIHKTHSHISAQDRRARNLKSKARYYHLLHLFQASTDDLLIDIERYGLGSERSVRSYEAFSGLDMTRQEPTLRASQSWYGLTSSKHWLNTIRPDSLLRNMRFHHAQLQAIDPGSTNAETQQLCQELAQMMPRLDIRSLLDAGCGLYDWLLTSSIPFQKYIGLDFLKEVYDLRLTEREDSSERQIDFLLGDIRNCDLPKVDLILCRDCFTHFNYECIAQAIAQIKRSRSRYLLCSHYTKSCNENLNVTMHPGKWARINLTLHPYDFPQPLQLLKDSEPDGKYLALWRIEDLPDLPIHSPIPARENDSLFQSLHRRYVRSVLNEHPFYSVPQKTMQQSLAKLMTQYQIASIADVGCGLSSWMLDAELPFNHYTGIDLLPEVYQARQSQASQLQDSRVEFRQADIRYTVLEAFDAILCRDVLTLMNYQDFIQALACIKASGSHYLICTHDQTFSLHQDYPFQTGFHSINFRQYPYHFPPPLEVIPEEPGSSKTLALWEVASLPDLANLPQYIPLPRQIHLTLLNHFLNRDESDYLYSLYDATFDYRQSRRKAAFAQIGPEGIRQSAITQKIVERMEAFEATPNLVICRTTEALSLRHLPEKMRLLLLLPPRQQNAQITTLDQQCINASHGALIQVTQQSNLILQPADPVYLCPQTQKCEWALAFVAPELTIEQVEQWVSFKALPML